jgi:hypothetical protein
MDVTAQRQADCYRPKQGAWVLAPHGRGASGADSLSALVLAL